MPFKVLIITDHTNHSSENSLYALANAMLKHHKTDELYVASKGNFVNNRFFQCEVKTMFATKVASEIAFDKVLNPLALKLVPIDVDEYDLVWLRMPPPLSHDLLKFIKKIFCDAIIINDPMGIYETGSKEFLLYFPEVCAPMDICSNKSDILKCREHHPVVLKPFREYGGKGIVKIDADKVSVGNEQMELETFLNRLPANKPLEYLAVKYLKNVTQGDKRIVVVNGNILGASLRKPAEGSWMCNASMGGTSHYAQVEPEEYQIIETINPLLRKKGIAMYGVDTLVDDNGKRVLSEINTTSIGGIKQIAQLNERPAVEQTIDFIWEYFMERLRS